MKSRYCAVLVLWLAGAGTASGANVDFAAHVEESTVQVLTEDEDGSARETTVWLVVVDGAGYVRGGASGSWGTNTARTPDIALRVGGIEIPVRAEPVEDPALRASVEAAFLAKYGLQDRIRGWFAGGHPRIFRLAPR